MMHQKVHLGLKNYVKNAMLLSVSAPLPYYLKVFSCLADRALLDSEFHRPNVKTPAGEKAPI